MSSIVCYIVYYIMYYIISYIVYFIVYYCQAQFKFQLISDSIKTVCLTTPNKTKPNWPRIVPRCSSILAFAIFTGTRGLLRLSDDLKYEDNLKYEEYPKYENDLKY